ncbi:uncharacterized protein PGTG_21776 [Puccinia graminis f. sp. tritici CRL 75-36-700-3]|uniref:Uncharacterized protein n=1 Tax=Puccinia graminis f. sp. tritici (strain CRL 75-36-700-3 / race SCCL) TaxID=418459 RepID=H6QSF5_PUCGT|nr:uncharacterized protein PGTG_21776 [Puccinia graminis f. sp. tritici CRL 75-36-700-3]EHS63691.1 hypothetical protein PGTG_21776 [Puccinia graminis f. sp. tritici CRL 75-36-700-3]
MEFRSATHVRVSIARSKARADLSASNGRLYYHRSGLLDSPLVIGPAVSFSPLISFAG